jgi:hypothetical protein
VDFILSSIAVDGDDGIEDDVPPAETTLTERSVWSLSWGFNTFNVDRIPILEVEDVDMPGGDLDEDSLGWDEDMKVQNVAVVQERWE